MNIPLIVDLDRTFVSYDTFLADVIHMAGKDLRILVKSLFLYFTARRAAAKHLLASYTCRKQSYDRLNRQFLAFVKAEYKKRPLYLVTGASQFHAEGVAKKYPYFQQVVASSESELMSVKNKLRWIADVGLKEFDYAGDRLGDCKIFNKARHSYIVNPTICLGIWARFKRSKNITCFDLPGLLKSGFLFFN